MGSVRLVICSSLFANSWGELIDKHEQATSRDEPHTVKFRLNIPVGNLLRTTSHSWDKQFPSVGRSNQYLRENNSAIMVRVILVLLSAQSQKDGVRKAYMKASEDSFPPWSSIPVGCYYFAYPYKHLHPSTVAARNIHKCTRVYLHPIMD